jgi:hypothetical protein
MKSGRAVEAGVTGLDVDYAIRFRTMMASTTVDCIRGQFTGIMVHLSSTYCTQTHTNWHPVLTYRTPICSKNSMVTVYSPELRISFSPP